MNLLNNLKYKHQVAKKFTEPFINEVKKNVKDYEAENPAETLPSLDFIETVHNRYRVVIPLIFTNHEAMVSSMFDRPPELIFSAGGQDDDQKKRKVEASYQYLVDKLDIEWLMNDVAWYFVLNGFVATHAMYKQEIEEVPMLDELTGEPVIDEMTGEPVMRAVYRYDDPVIEVDDPLKTQWSPESKFSINGEKVPYYIREELMSKEMIMDTYGVDVEPDAVIEYAEKVKTLDTEKVNAFKRVKVFFFYGQVDHENRGEVEDWDIEANYYIVFTKNKVLYKERIDQKNCTLLKWYGVPSKFFGFGYGKILRPFQKEKSYRRSQQIRYGDVAAFPKLAVDDTAQVDKKAMIDPRENVVLLYTEKKPEYVVPPDMSNVVQANNLAADEDAQRAAGLLDLQTGAQNTSTVDTATGQSIFAEAAEKRVRMAKRRFLAWYEQTAIMLLKLAQKHWSEDKLITITDEDGQEETISVSAQDLSDVNFDTDVKINPETLSINKDILRQQAIELYNTVKDDPLVERKAVFSDMLRLGFQIENPQRYIKDNGLQPGSQLVDQQTGQLYVVDETGSITQPQDMQQLAEPTGMGGGIPSSPAGMMGAAQTIN